MAIRDFTDSDGTLWHVWRVQPTGAQDPAYNGPERRRNTGGEPILERRRRPVTRASFIPGLEQEKRRLFPAPADWESCPPEALAWYCQKAEPVRTREHGTFSVEIQNTESARLHEL
jgi:hypothetical protein